MILTSLKELKALGDSLRASGKKIVWSNGCFDLLHYGHVINLKQARSYGDVLVVGVNGDDSPYFQHKPGRPLNSEKVRTEVVQSLQCVDHVFIFREETPIEAIRMLTPDVLVKGGDYKATELVGYDVVTEHGGRVEIVPLVAGYSTTALIRKILKTYADPPDSLD